MIIHVNPADVSGKSVARPEEALVLLRKENGEKKMVIHSGVYYGTQLRLTKEDNGLIIEGSGQGRAVMSGGIPVENWFVDSETGWFYADVPQVDGKAVDFRLLLSGNGDYLKKARYPLEGVLEHCSVFKKEVWRGSCYGGWGRMFEREELDRFEYNPKDFSEDFVFENAEVQVFHSWNESYTNVVGMNCETNTFYVDPPCGHPVGSFGHKEYVVYNTVEGMAEDGRWYHDKKNSRIYYRPYPGETSENFSAIVPITSNVILLSDGCENITIRGIDVTVATTPVVTDIFSTEVMRGAGGFVSKEQSGAIEGEGLKNIVLENLNIYKTGGHAIKIKGEELFVRGAKISECGAGGVMLDHTREIPENPSEELLSGWPRVENCRIDNIGLDYYSAVAIFINNAVACGNYINYTPYSGIVAYGDNILIENNIVLDPMQVLEDGAAIYKLLDKKGVIRNNYMSRYRGEREVKNYKGLYLDAPGEGFVMYGNVVKGFKTPCYHHIGEPDTIWENNYFEYDGDMVVGFNRTLGARIKNNVFKSTGVISIVAPEEAIAEFTGNVMRHGGEYVSYEVVKDYGRIKPPYPFEADSSNSIEKNLS